MRSELQDDPPAADVVPRASLPRPSRSSARAWEGVCLLDTPVATSAPSRTLAPTPSGRRVRCPGSRDCGRGEALGAGSHRPSDLGAAQQRHGDGRPPLRPRRPPERGSPRLQLCGDLPSRGYAGHTATPPLAPEPPEPRGTPAHKQDAALGLGSGMGGIPVLGSASRGPQWAKCLPWECHARPEGSVCLECCHRQRLLRPPQPGRWDDAEVGVGRPPGRPVVPRSLGWGRRTPSGWRAGWGWRR